MGLQDRDTLTVLVVTYNHEDYIAEALESIHLQEDVTIDRLIISDDHSTDATIEVVRETIARLGMAAEVRTSDIQRGITPHYKELFDELDTDLVAILEGDDYWFGAKKLKQQMELLRRYPHASACTLAYMLYHQERDLLEGRTCTGDLIVLGTEDIIAGGDGFGFSNMLYRVDALRQIPPAFFTIRSYDWIVNILVSRVGPVLKLDTPGVVHRITTRGAWAGRDHAAQLEEYIDSIQSYIPHCDACTAALLVAKLTEVRERLDEVRSQAALPQPAVRVRSAPRARRAVRGTRPDRADVTAPMAHALPARFMADPMGWHYDVLPMLVRALNPEVYLELGVREANLFNRVSPHVGIAIGVDIDPMSGECIVPAPNVEFHLCTTDEFLEQAKQRGLLVDVLFIDADHSYEAALQDFRNYFPIVRPHGLILMHDGHPGDASLIRPNACGGVYQAVQELSAENKDYEMATIPMSPGLTICRKRTVQLSWQESDTGVEVARFRGPDASSAPPPAPDPVASVEHQRVPFGNRIKATLRPVAAAVLGEGRLRRTLARMRGRA